jgi:hypothetical protein
MLGISVKSIDLFREAISCYQNWAFLASCIMCRTALDFLKECDVYYYPLSALIVGCTLPWLISAFSTDIMALSFTADKSK